MYTVLHDWDEKTSRIHTAIGRLNSVPQIGCALVTSVAGFTHVHNAQYIGGGWRAVVRSAG